MFYKQFFKRVSLLVVVLYSTLQAPAQLLKKKEDPDKVLPAIKAALARGEYQKGIALGQDALEKRPADNDIRFLLGQLYYRSSKDDSALQVFKAVVTDAPQYRDAYLYLINLNLRKKKYEEALCYADDALFNFPGDQEFVLKKMALLNLLGNYRYANKYAEQLVNEYPADTLILRKYIDIKIEQGQRDLKQGNYARARYNLERALEEDPANKEVFETLYNLELRSGNDEKAMEYINQALTVQPNSYDYLLKKVDMLQRMRRYADAEETLRKMMRLYPSDSKLQRLSVDMKMEAGRYYLNTDPYVQFQGVLDKAPGNTEALDYVINIASARGMYADALQWCNKALRAYPNSNNYLKKKMGILESMQRYTPAAAIAQQLWQQNPSAANLDALVNLRTLSGRSYMNGMQYDSALYEFGRVLSLKPGDMTALNYSINILSGLKRYDEAIAMVNQALASYPGNELLLFKKAGLLETDGRFTDAAAIMGELVKQYPDNPRYRQAFADELLANGRLMMQAEEYEAAIDNYHLLLQAEPHNREALNNMVNAQHAVQRYDSALWYNEQALALAPSSKELLVRKASLLNALHRYREAASISSMLLKRYPHQTKIKEVYIDNLLAAGRELNRNGKTDSALQVFEEVLAVSPNDSSALVYSINLLNAQGRYDAALALIDRGVQYYPDNSYFITKRAVVLENKKEYALAALAADSAARLLPTEKNLDYARYLKSKLYKNQIGASFLYSTLETQRDSGATTTRANIATIQYLRYIKRGTLAARLNFAGRTNGTGLQLELESYYSHNPQWYSFINVAVANKVVFPQYRVAYSLFHNFKHGWEAELGGRYLNFDTVSTAAVVASAGKYLGDFWINLRGFLLFQQGKTFQTGVLSVRQYMDDAKNEFVFATLGAGNSPDEFSRNFQLADNLGYKTYSIGAGYQKTFLYRNTILLSGTWYNQKLPKRYRNQYDIYLSFMRKF